MTLKTGTLGTITPAAWADAGSLTGVTVGTVVVEAAFTALFVEVPFTLSTGTIASIVGQIRATRRPARVHAMLDFKTPPGQAFAIAAAMDLQPGTEYELRIVVTDNVGGTQTLVETATTRGETIPAADTLTPTRFVSATGSDSNDGLTRDTAWRTFTKFWDTAPVNSITEFGPGIFVDSSPFTSTTSQTGSTIKRTIVARYPACGDFGEEEWPESLHSMIVPAAAYRTAKGAKAWTQITLTGPGNAGATAGAEYSVWRYQSTGDSGTRHLFWHETETSPLQRVAHWKIDASHLATAAGWAEKLYTNKSYHYGFWCDSNGDIYLRMPGDRSPNDVYITMMNAGNPVMFRSTADGSRVNGLRFRGWHTAVATQNGVDDVVVDHCWIESPGTGGIHFHNDAATTPGVRSVVQHCRFTDTNMRAARGQRATDNHIIPWQGVKSAIVNADGTNYGTTKLFNNAENRALSGRRSDALVVFRWNTIDGLFNGVYSGDQTGATRACGRFWHIHGNLFLNAADDAIEPEGANVGWLCHDNDVEDCLVYLSTGPNSYGPVWAIRERVWRLGNNGVGLPAVGGEVAGQSPPGSYGFKYSGSGSPECTICVYHSTFWTDDPACSGGEEVASPGSNEDRFDVRSCIMRFGRYAFLFADAAAFTENYNLWATSDATRGLRAGSTTYQTTVQLATYRTATSQGAQSNKVGGVDQVTNAAEWLDALLVAPTIGDLGMTTAVAAQGVPGVSDRIPNPSIGAFVRRRMA